MWRGSVDFKRLGYFALVAELGSLTRTSERLGIAQPSLSRQMRILEQELGVTLFTRGHRGMQLTEAGELLRARIAGPLRQIGHAIYEVRSLPTETGGSVVFGMTPTMIQLLAGPLARRVAAAAPNIALRIVDGHSGRLLEWMRGGELDGAILYGPSPAGVNATKLVEDDLGLVGPPGDAVTGHGPVELARLAELPLVLPSPMHGLRITLEAAAAKVRTTLNVAHQADSFHLMKELVESRLGYTALPQVAVERELAAGRLSFSPIRNPPARRQLYLAMHSGSQSPRAVLQVEDFVRDEVAGLVRDGRWPGAGLCSVGDS